MAQFETWLRSDLSKPIMVRKLTGNLYSGDSGANLIGVEVTNNGEPVTLSGGVYGYVLRADGVTVTIEGDLDGNKAWVVLPMSAYAVIGIVSIVVKVGGTTVGACSTSVYRTSTTAVIDPGYVVPDVSALLAAAEECAEATAAAEAAADNAVLYSGSQSLTDAQKEQARTNIGAAATDDVNELESAMQVLEPSATSSDVGKFLKAKTVTNGKVTEYEFGEGGGNGQNILYPISDQGGRPAGYVDIDLGTTWESGTINSSTGANAENGNCLRTAGFVSFSEDIDQIHVSYASDNITAFIVWYNSSYERSGSSGSIDGIVPYDFDNPVSSTRIYWRIVVEYKDHSTPDATLPTLLKIQYYDPGEPGGHTDRTTEIETMLSEYGECILAKGDFYTTGIDMPTGSKLRGQGESTNLILVQSVTDGCAINPLGDNTIADMVISQEGGASSKPASGTEGTVFGVLCPNNVHLIRIQNCDFKGFSGAGVYGYGSSTNDCMSAVIDGCRFLYCVVGIWLYGGMEYNKVSNCTCNFCYFGIRNEGGNNLITNSNFNKNEYGYAQLTNGVTPGNFGHGSVVGCTFNHNTTMAIHLYGGGNGMVFTGCQIWDGEVRFRSIKGILFSSCEFGGSTVKITFWSSYCAGNRIIDCSFSAQPTIYYLGDATASSYILDNNYLFDGTPVVFNAPS